MEKSEREHLKFEQWKRDTTAQLTNLSGQIREIKRDMVTRREYNDAQDPLVKMVAKHDRIYVGAVKGLVWIGISTLAASIISPHWSVIAKRLMEFVK